MSLISCPDCNNEVSDIAPACPKCGRPIDQESNIAATKGALTTTQLTSKKYKIHTLISSMLALFLAPMFIIPALLFSGDGKFSEAITLVVLGVGILIYWLYIRYKVWWHHSELTTA